MGSKYTKRYTEEFKRDAIALVDSSGKTVTAVARELGISSESLRGWYRRVKADRGEGKSGELTSAGREELKRLRKEVREQQQTIEILKEARTRVLRAGESEAVVMLHGTSGRLEAFVRNVPELSEHFALHALDMLGHGYTANPGGDLRIPRYVRHVLDYLDSRAIQRAHFIGESLGGWVAGRLAADHPDRVGRLILVAPGGTVANPEVMDRIRTSTKAAVTSDDRDLTRRRLELLMHDAVNVSEELVDVRHAIYHRPEFVAGIDELLCLQKMENRTEDLLTPEQMARIAAPTQIVWGAQNPFGNVPEAHRMQQSIPGSALEIFPECGHWPQHEHADRFNKLAVEFLGRGRA